MLTNHFTEYGEYETLRGSLKVLAQKPTQQTLVELFCKKKALRQENQQMDISNTVSSYITKHTVPIQAVEGDKNDKNETKCQKKITFFQDHTLLIIMMKL